MLACPHRPPCPGCPRLGEADIDPTARARLEAFARAHGLDGIRTVRGEETGYRHRARLAIRGRAASPKLGIFASGSHRVIDIPRCLVHHPLINEVIGELRSALRDTRTPTYSDDAHLGLVRYVQIVVERSSLTAQVVVVTNATTPDSSATLLSSLTERLGPRLHSLFWNGNPVRTNAILGPLWHRVEGPEAVEERLGGARVFYPPGAFGQSHLPLSAALIDEAHGFVPDGARVAEFYAGVGAIGLGLAHRVAELHANELAEESRHGLELGIAALSETVRTRVHAVHGTAGDAAGLASTSDVAIVDPPRKGLDPALLAALVETPPPRVVYVACGLQAFLSDAAAITAGRARLTALSVYDMFPYTEHVEVLARFDRGEQRI